MKGLKIRCTGTTQRIVSHLGASPVGMTQTQTYGSVISKGVVDGLHIPRGDPELNPCLPK